MKKILILFLVMLSLTVKLSADQLAYISEEQAKRGAELIKSQKEVLLFCGCCGDDPKVYLKVANAYVEHTGYQNYHQVIITGKDRSGKEMRIEADLAYVHINRNGMAVAAGKILGLECDPCVDNLKWDIPKK